MDNQYTDLCKRIHLRCKQNHWYSPDEHRYQWHTAQTYDATGKLLPVGEAVGIFDYRGYIDLPTCERQHNDESTIELLPGVWPSHFLHFCYVGCGIDIFVDGKTGKVYSVEAGHRVEGGYTTSIRRLHNSVEGWLEHRLRDEKSIRV